MSREGPVAARGRGAGARTLGRLLALAAPYGPRMALAVLLGTATIASSIGLLATSGFLIAAAALQPSIADLQIAIVGVRFFGISRGVARYLERYVSHDVTFRLLARLRLWFYRSVEPLAPARLLEYRSGDLLARVVADVDTLEDVYLRVIAPPVVALLVALLACFLLGGFDVRLAGVLLVFLLLAGAGLPLLVRALGQRAGRHLVRVRANLNSVLVDGIQGVADLLAFGGEEHYMARVVDLGRDLSRLRARMVNIDGLQGALSGLLMNLATMTVLSVAAGLVNTGQLDGMYLALLVMTVIASFEAVLPLPQALLSLDHSLEAAHRLFEIVDADPAVRDPVPAAPIPAACDIRVEALQFRYGPEERPALRGVSFDLPQGACLAVVGPSGAGKSTLARLLLRFWDYEQGHITWDGRELGSYGQEDLRRHVAVVSQQTYLFNATVRENLLLALRPEAAGAVVERNPVSSHNRPGPEADCIGIEARMIQAAQQARIHEFIQSLPQGYDTWIGEQGLRLSGGQRQRLAIARAILQNAPVLLLDEPTANLDALTERDVMASLQSLMAGRTTLLITHRLVGLEAADEILVLRRGCIVERGRHHELLQMGGTYRRMWDLQSQWLSPDRRKVGE